MVLRYCCSVLLLFLLLSTCNHGYAAKDLKEKHPTIDFHRDCDEVEEKSSSPSSRIARLESSYKPSYAVDETEDKIAQLESKYNPAYGVDESDEEKIARIESKYKLGYGVYVDKDKIAVSQHKPSYGVDEEKMANIESKYSPGYRVDEANEAKMARIESKYKLGYGVYVDKDKITASQHKPSYGVDEEKMAELKSKYTPSYTVNEANEQKMADLESKYSPSYTVDEANEEKMARIESKYKLGYGVYVDKDKIATSQHKPSYGVDEEKMANLESKYSPGYRVEEANEEKMARIESKYCIGYGMYVDNEKMAHLDESEEKVSTQESSKYCIGYGVMDHHHHHHAIEQDDDDIRSEDVGVFTIEDVLAFDVGKKLSIFFSIRKPDFYPGFLPREVADSIPFSVSDTNKILQFFSVSPHSPKGEAIIDTVRLCEIEPVKGETKTCATSQESMLEFLKDAFMEVDFKSISTTHPSMKAPILQSYIISQPPREIESQKKVTCHPLPYLYAVYMCHYDNSKTRVFEVPLVGDNGDKVNAVVVCHMDTSVWSPKHTAFSLLGTKPGIPVCHTFSEGHVVWVQSSATEAVM